MQITRRIFLKHAPNVVTTFAGMGLVWSVSCGKSPMAPTSVQSMPSASPAPNNPTSPYGTYHRGGFAGIKGTLAEVLVAARLAPQINSAGLLLALDGRVAPLVPGSTERRGYFFHVRGQWFAGSVHNITLNPSDAWDIFDWNGSNP